MVYYRRIGGFPRPALPREVVMRMIWKPYKDGFVLVTLPTSLESRPVNKENVRAEYLSAMRITVVNEQETQIRYVISPDAGSFVPGLYLILRTYVARYLEHVTAIRMEMQSRRPLASWGEKDGEAVGDALCMVVKAEKVRNVPYRYSSCLELTQVTTALYAEMPTRLQEGRSGAALVQALPGTEGGGGEVGMAARDAREGA
jgi:hypothetical protein